MAPGTILFPDNNAVSEVDAGATLLACINRLQYPLQDDVLDTLYWLRQALGLLMGLVWGILSLTGIIAFCA